MSANLLDGATVTRGTKDSDGYWVLSQNDGTDKKDSPMWRIDGQPTLTENQTIHMACSVMPDEDLSTNAINIGVRYKDAAGNSNWTGAYRGKNSKAGVWTRLEMECVVPSGMRVDWCVLANAYSHAAGAKVTGVTISYGSPVCLASSAHTPYATQDHLRSEYATKAALKVTSDAVTAEVTERGKLAGRVGTLESTSGTHASRLEQLAASIKSLVKGESTYTDPDGKSATSGIYSLVEQTRDSVTALFGQYTKTTDMQSQIATAKSQATSAANSATDGKLADYTKTADLASTAAVRDAKRAGTDAASAASAAQSTADAAKTAAASAQSTADAAKGTADGLATMIRQDSSGITVGKSTDGTTYSSVHTHMGTDGFDVLDKAGKVLSSFGASLVTLGTNAAAILLAGILRVESLQTHPAVAGGSQLTVDVGRVSVPVHAESGAPWSAIELAGRNDTSGAATTALRAEFSVNNKDGSIQPYVYVDCDMTVDGTLLMSDKASTLGTRKGLRITQGSKVCHGHGTPWVTLFETWDEFQSATGCYDSGTPTLVTMNGDFGAFDGTLSGCEVKCGSPVYVLAQTTSGLPNISSSQSLRINWICIW